MHYLVFDLHNNDDDGVQLHVLRVVDFQYIVVDSSSGDGGE